MSDVNKNFMKIRDAATATGLSCYFLRRGCWDGTVPHIKIGRVYYVNVVRLLEMLDAESVQRG